MRRPPAPDWSYTVSDDFKPGLEGVIAFESEIAEPDKDCLLYTSDAADE